MSKDESKINQMDADAIITKSVSEGINQGLRAILGDPNAPAPTPDEMHRQLVKKMIGRDVPEPEQVISWKIHNCISPYTKSTFTAVVSKSKSIPQGRIVAMEDYVYPEEANEAPMTKYRYMPGAAASDEFLTIEYKHWRWTNFWQRDLKEIVGKPMYESYKQAAKVVSDPLSQVA